MTPTDTVRDRVMRHGRLSSAYQILNPGFTYWLDAALDAAAGYVRRGRWWVVGGAPLCPAGREADAVRALEADARRDGCSVVYVCAADPLRQTTDAVGHHATITLGAEPTWRPGEWWQRPAKSASLRQQLNRARNKGVVVSPLSRDDVDRRANELRPIVLDWLATRPLPAMRFLNDPRTLDGDMAARRLWVARQGERAVAFLLASPVPLRRGYLFEQIARRHDAPNGTAELLIDAAMRDVAAVGCDYATLGLVVVASHARTLMDRAPWWARTMFTFARAHGRRFYNFDGLAKFREKLRPDGWEPVHLIASRRPFPPAALYAAGAAFCGERSPAGVVAQGMRKGLTTEFGWAAAAVRRLIPSPGIPGNG